MLVSQPWWTAGYLPAHRERVRFAGGADGFVKSVLGRVGAMLQLPGGVSCYPFLVMVCSMSFLNVQSMSKQC